MSTPVKQNAWLGILDRMSEYRWPNSGDRLLIETGDWSRGVQFPKDSITRHVFIWDGYMKAGELLIDACEEHKPERYDLIYPIIFNYRHGIELAMKWVICHYGHYSNVQIDDIEDHNLWKLWQTCKQIITEAGSEDEAISVVQQVIKDFHDLDKSAQAFRYAEDLRGDIFDLPDRMIDIQNIKDVMEGVSNFFSAVDGQLGDYTGGTGR